LSALSEFCPVVARFCPVLAHSGPFASSLPLFCEKPVFQGYKIPFFIFSRRVAFLACVGAAKKRLLEH
jgi:hypothetical protein